jgi:hypothetical protein
MGLHSRLIHNLEEHLITVLRHSVRPSVRPSVRRHVTTREQLERYSRYLVFENLTKKVCYAAPFLQLAHA